MDYSNIASVSGRGGLFKVLKPTKTGVILESMDEKQQRIVAGATQRVSVLSDISIYTTSQEGSTPLQEVFLKIYEEFEEDLGVTSSADPDELKAFLKHVVPNYDERRVYVSDIKKLINWYSSVLRYVPDLLKQKQEETKATDDTTAVEE